MESEQEIKESAPTEEETNESVLSDLAAHVPWDQIAHKYHISTKTISRIRDAANSRNDSSLDNSEAALASKAFEHFNNERSAVDAVVDLKILPDVAMSLYQKWVSMKREGDPKNPQGPKSIEDLERRVAQLEENEEYWQLTYTSVARLDDFVFHCLKCDSKIEDGLACPKCGYKLPWER